MVQAAVEVKFRELDNELEALLTEADLIRLYQPPVNVLLKDDKSPIYLLITAEKYSRVLTIRKREQLKMQRAGTVLGPFPSAYKLREVLKLMRPIFPWCNEASDPQKRRARPRACFHFHLGLCPGACIELLPPADYSQTIAQLADFLRGRTKEIRAEIADKLKEAAEAEKYEKAAELRDRLLLIKEVTSKQYKLAPDILTGTQLLSNDQEHQLFQLKQQLVEHQLLPPQVPLHRIECYDVSNIQGKNAVVAMTCFVDGAPARDQYRLFNIRTLNTPNDYRMLQEALARRQNHPEWGRPDLVVIDGGKGQVNAALKVWTWRNAVIGIAKHPDRLVIPQLDWNAWQEGELHPVAQPRFHLLALPLSHPGLRLVQQLRDEAHRFSNRQRVRLASRDLLD
jgi:excinuclease ABC subunit C